MSCIGYRDALTSVHNALTGGTGNKNGGKKINSKDQNTDCIFSDSILACKIDEMKDAFGLVYRTYLESGLQKIDKSSMRMDISNLLPSSYLVIVQRNGKICGTLTLVNETEGRLPIEELYSEEIGRIRETGSIICEFSALAVDTTLSNEYRVGILMSLFRKALILGNDLLKCTDLCIMIHPRHTAYYQRKFYFEKIGKLLPLEKVNGALAVPLRLNLKIARKKIHENDLQMYQYFYETDHQIIKEQTVRELNDRRTLYDIELVNHFRKIKPNLLENLTTEKKRMLVDYYPELKGDSL